MLLGGLNVLEGRGGFYGFFSAHAANAFALHIMVDKGVNIRAISASIIKEVRYFVTKSTGTEVSAVNVFVDSITID